MIFYFLVSSISTEKILREFCRILSLAKLVRKSQGNKFSLLLIQCDQMDRVLVQFLGIYSKENLPNSIK